MKSSRKSVNTKLRFNIITIIIYLIGIILLVQLFNLQIINGEEYRQTSNTRLSRQSTLQAARGSIVDRYGNVIAGTRMGFALELYKSKVDNDTLNNTILNIVKVLEKNGDKYIDTFPITEDLKFNFSSKEKLSEWKKAYEIDANATAQKCIEFFKEKYKIENNNIKEVRKIISIRYLISKEGYSATKPIQIAEDISRESAIQFNELNSKFPGINVVIEPIRQYKNGSLAAHIVGYIGKIKEEELEADEEKIYDMNDYVGRMGIEYVFEKYLRGTNGTKQIDMAVDGTVTDEYVEKEAIAGSDVVLTIDANLQETVEKELEKSIKALQKEKYKTTFGAVVVMDVKTGEVLSMASYPTFNPELFVGGISEKDYKPIKESEALYSRALQGAYAPGSTFKMVVSAAALETGAVTETETVNDTGVYPYGHKPVCWYYTTYHRGHGYINIKTAIQKSCNFFFYEMGRRVGIDNLEKYAKYFGLGEKTGIELPSETSGKVASKKIVEEKNEQWYLSDTLSASIGQSYNKFSPLQMARYISILANGGNKVDATIIKTIKRNDGTEVSKQEIQQYVNSILGTENNEDSNLKISKKTIKTIMQGMKMVTSSAGGTAYSVFNNFNITVGGKTGSAQAIDNGVEKTNGWFVGFAPYNNPEIAISVILEDGAEENDSAKLAKKILEYYFGTNSRNVKENMSAIPTVETIR